MDPVITRITSFLHEIGLNARADSLPDSTFLPGVTLRQGAVVYDPAKLTYPGDLLHEAGHLAVVPPEKRILLDGDAGNDPAEEMMAIAWSWAAVLHLELDPTLVFHKEFKGGGDSIIANFSNRHYFGVPMLQWVGLTEQSYFPKMFRWVRS